MARNRSEEPAAPAAFEIDADAPSTPAAGDAQPQPEPEAPSPPPLELVTEPGPKKRIVFEGDAKPAPQAASEPAEDAAPAPAPAPAATPAFAGSPASYARPPLRTSEDIEDIRSRVDSLGRPDPGFAGRPPRANLQPIGTRSRTLYTTEQGNEVRIYDGPSPTLTLTHRRGQRVEERPFDERMVDEAIGGLDRPARSGMSPGDAEATSEDRGWDASLTEKAPTPGGTQEGQERRKRRFGLFGRRRGQGKEAAETPVAETGPETVVPAEPERAAPTPPPAEPAAAPPAMRHFRPVTLDQADAVGREAPVGPSGEGWDPGERHGSAEVAGTGSSGATEHYSRTTTTTTRTTRSTSRSAGGSSRARPATKAASGKKGTSSKRAAKTAGRKRSK